MSAVRGESPMGCFYSKKEPDVQNSAINTEHNNNNNIMLFLRGRETGKRGSNGGCKLMENYMSQILLMYTDNVLYENGPTYKTCIESFRENVPVNCFEYQRLREQFNWLRFEMEPHARYLHCHMNDFVGSMRLQTVNHLLEIGSDEPFGPREE